MKPRQTRWRPPASGRRGEVTKRAAVVAGYFGPNSLSGTSGQRDRGPGQRGRAGFACVATSIPDRPRHRTIKPSRHVPQWETEATRAVVSVAPVPSWGNSAAGEQDLQRSGLGGVGEDAVGGLELVEAESVSDHGRRLESVAGNQTDQRRRGVRVDKAGGNGQVLDPDVLQMQGRRSAVHTDIGDVTARTH